MITKKEIQQIISLSDAIMKISEVSSARSGRRCAIGVDVLEKRIQIRDVENLRNLSKQLNTKITITDRDCETFKEEHSIVVKGYKIFAIE